MILGTKFPTLLDVEALKGPDGKLVPEGEIVNSLAIGNEVLQDMHVVEANDGSGHKTVTLTGIPQPTWRLLNNGVQPTKATTVPNRDSSGMLEDYAEVDKSLADMTGNPRGFRAIEDLAHLEGINQEMMRTLFYGNTAITPQKFLGLAPRFATKAGAASGDNIILGDGAGVDNTSIYLVVWGPRSVHAFYPRGSKAGILTEDKGQQTIYDATGGRYEAYRTHYKWDLGLTVRDWRYVVRIANIDVSNLTKDAATGTDITDLMTQAVELLPPGFESVGQPVFYMNRTVRSVLRRQIKNGKNMNLTMEEVAGKPVMAFDGIPVRRVDVLLNSEAAVA